MLIKIQYSVPPPLGFKKLPTPLLLQGINKLYHALLYLWIIHESRTACSAEAPAHGLFNTWRGIFDSKNFRHVEFSAWRIFGRKNFRQEEFLEQKHFGIVDISTRGLFSTGIFWHWEFLASGIFGTDTFLHGDISTHDEMSPCQKFPTLKILRNYMALWSFVSSGLENSLCQCPNVQVKERQPCQNISFPKCFCAKNFPCWKVPMSKHSRVEPSMCGNVLSAKRCTCQNVPMMKHPCRNVRCRNELKPFL